MDTKNILLFGAGFLIGYLIVENRRSKNYLLSEASPEAGGSTISPVAQSAGTSVMEEVVIEDPKISMCKEKWIKFAETRKFTSAEQAQSTYDNFMTSCMVQQ